MLVLHSMTVVVENVRPDECTVCGVKHELYMCKKCGHLLDCNGMHELLVKHEQICTGKKLEKPTSIPHQLQYKNITKKELPI